MNWLKKYSFLILLAGAGIVYLSVVDHWQVYAESLNRMKAFYQRTFYGVQAFPGQIVEVADGDGTLDQIPGDHDGASDGEGNSKDQQTSGGEDENGVNGSGGGDIPVPEGGSHRTEDGFWDGSEPVYMTVEDDYFSDAVFIGDSRTVGLYEYGGLEEITTFYASKGLTIYRLFESEIVEAPGQKQKLTVEDALLNTEFRKIYLMVGINEMGTGTVETFTAKYK